MGQRELYELLKELGLAHPNRFYSKARLQVLLTKKGLSPGQLYGLSKDLVALDRAGFIDVKYNWSGKVLDWRKEVRLKNKYL